MKKLLGLILLITLVLAITGCVTTVPVEVGGTWKVTTSVPGSPGFDITITRLEGNSINIEATGGVTVTGGYTTMPENRIFFLANIDGVDYGFYGMMSPASMNGFARFGVKGDLCGYWVATRQ